MGPVTFIVCSFHPAPVWQPEKSYLVYSVGARTVALTEWPTVARFFFLLILCSFLFFFSIDQLFSAVTFTNACRASLGFCKVIIVDPLAVCVFKSSAILSPRLPTTPHSMQSALASSFSHSITFFISHPAVLSFFLSPRGKTIYGPGWHWSSQSNYRNIIYWNIVRKYKEICTQIFIGHILAYSAIYIVYSLKISNRKTLIWLWSIKMCCMFLQHFCRSFHHSNYTINGSHSGTVYSVFCI